MSSTVYQTPFDLSSVVVLSGYFILYAPVFGSRERSEQGGLVNESISCRRDEELRGVFRTDPYPERRTPVAVAVVNPGGVAVKLQGKTSVHNPSGAGDRGVITGRSRKSRRRLMDYLSRVDMRPLASQRVQAKRARAAFVTLTYPADFPSWRVAKEDLLIFRKRLQRAFPVQWAVWVQEFQARGAVHFHLVLVWRSPVDMERFRSWLSRVWYEVVDSGDEKHLLAGTQAVAVHLKAGVGSLMSYLAGELGKVRQVRPVDARTGELIETGRTWGIWYKPAMPLVTVAIVAIQDGETWREFKRRVSSVFRKSRYLRGIEEYSEWQGALLYGDGLALMNELLTGLDFRYSPLPS